jgi:hypothetical protein
VQTAKLGQDRQQVEGGKFVGGNCYFALLEFAHFD